MDRIFCKRVVCEPETLAASPSPLEREPGDKAIERFVGRLFDGDIAHCIGDDGVWLNRKVIQTACLDMAYPFLGVEGKIQYHFSAIIDHIAVGVILLSLIHI